MQILIQEQNPIQKLQMNRFEEGTIVVGKSVELTEEKNIKIRN